MDSELNRILHQPIRTRIMAYLVLHSSADYILLKQQFNLSDGHMTTHMRELLAHNYVIAEKTQIDKKPKTTYYLTQTGRDAFLTYVQSLKRIVALGSS